MSSDRVTLTCDICVVGRGLIGAAAAKYLTVINMNSSIVAIGPDELMAKESEIFGAHHDEGRITRKTDINPIWALLAQRSIDHYRKIEHESGVHFYDEIGHLVVGMKDGEHIRKVLANAKASGIVAKKLDKNFLAKKYTFMRFPDNCEGILESNDSGWVSARRQVDAQLAIATKHGCIQVRVPVRAVQSCNIIVNGKYIKGFKVHGEDGSIIVAKKVLIATGSNCSHLLSSVLTPAHSQLDMHIRTAQTIKLKVADHDAALLADMPTIIYKVGPGDYDWCYLLPPILYPDGCIWLKIGGGQKITLETQSDVARWYNRKGWGTVLTKQHQSNKEAMLSVLDSLFPGLRSRATEVKDDTCVTVHTCSKLPFIGEVPNAPKGIFLATGDNGGAAKSADEIGRLAAISVSEMEWADQELSSEMFLPVLKHYSKY